MHCLVIFKNILHSYSFLKIIKQCVMFGNVIDSNSVIKMNGIKSDVKSIREVSCSPTSSNTS
jgi:hypothetical protein